MSLFDTALIDISMSDVFLMVNPCEDATPEHVHVLLAEYAKKQYALVVCELVDGVNVCADPPKVLYSIGFPNDLLSFTFEQEKARVIISTHRNLSFCLTFMNPGDFWEVVRIIAEAQAGEEVRKVNIKELLKDAVTTIPTVRLLPDGVVASGA